jgi:hypothetical protein
MVRRVYSYAGKSIGCVGQIFGRYFLYLHFFVRDKDPTVNKKKEKRNGLNKNGDVSGTKLKKMSGDFCPKTRQTP